MDTKMFDSVGAWRQAMHKAGYFVPGQLCMGAVKIMKKYDCTFYEALEILVKNKKIFIVGKFIIYDMSGDDL
jgi:hypothetical protein